MSKGLVMRVVTGVVGVPVLVFFLYFGGRALLAVLFLVAAVGLSEFFKAISAGRPIVRCCVYILAAGYYVLLFFAEARTAVLAAVFLLMLVLGTLAVVFHKSVNVKDIAAAFFGFCYIALPLSAIYITWRIGGGWFASVVFFSAWGCDTGAYIFGKTMGKRKLTPVLSPNKTVEGAAGGVLTAGLLVAGMAAIVYGATWVNILTFALAGVVCAVFSIFGDLFASSVKRFAGIKDFGGILPGHGGVIDRFDSILFTAPMLLLLTPVLIRIGIV